MTQKKLKELEIVYQNAIYICIIWCILLVFSEKIQISTELKKCVPIHIFSGSSLGNI